MSDIDIKKLYERFEKYLDSGRLFPHHDCSICDEYVGYLKVRGHIVFDSNCNCVSWRSELRPVEKNEIDEMLSGRLGSWPEHFEKVLHEGGF